MFQPKNQLKFQVIVSRLILLLPCLLSGLLEADERPNFIVIIGDDISWNDYGAYGHPNIRTPHVDQLVKQGMRFDLAFLTTSSCSPSRCSIMTGRYPHSTGAGGLHQPLPEDQITFAKVLKEAGYYTAAAGKWHLGNEQAGPLSQGFDVQIPSWNGCCPRGGYHPPYKMEGLKIEGKEDEYLTDRLISMALDFIEQAGEKPFFLYLSHFSVHVPIQGREDLVRKYQKKRVKLS